MEFIIMYFMEYFLPCPRLQHVVDGVNSPNQLDATKTCAKTLYMGHERQELHSGEF